MPEADTAAEFALVPLDTLAEASGHGPSFEVAPDGPRVFVLRLDVTETIEQQLTQPRARLA